MLPTVVQFTFASLSVATQMEFVPAVVSESEFFECLRNGVMRGKHDVIML